MDEKAERAGLFHCFLSVPQMNLIICTRKKVVANFVEISGNLNYFYLFYFMFLPALEVDLC